MFYVEKTFKIPMGHRLSKHQGLCKNFHGHNFVIKVKVCSKELDKNDMVIDFSDLKRIVNGILEEFDHCMLLNTNDGMKEKFYDVVRTWEFQGDPTAENLCQYFFDRISLGLVQPGQLKYIGGVRSEVKLVSVKIWENEDSVAEYIPE